MYHMHGASGKSIAPGAGWERLAPGLGDALGSDGPFPRPVIFGERRLDEFFGNLVPGELVYIETTTAFLFDAMYLLMVNALRNPDARVVYVDGCNAMDPYKITRMKHRVVSEVEIVGIGYPDIFN